MRAQEKYGPNLNIAFATKSVEKFNVAVPIFKSHHLDLEQYNIETGERSVDLPGLATKKAKFAAEKLARPCIVMDSSFYIHALHAAHNKNKEGAGSKGKDSQRTLSPNGPKGFPSYHVKYCLDEIGLEGFLDLLKRKSDRGCTLRFAVAYAYNDAYVWHGKKELKYFECMFKGQVADKPRGELREGQWSQIGMIVKPQLDSRLLATLSEDERDVWLRSQNKTLAEMTNQEYANWQRIIDKPFHDMAQWLYHDRWVEAKIYSAPRPKE